MSFSIRLPSGDHLENLPGASLGLNLECPIFDPQRTDRTWTFPLTIPRSPANEIALKATRPDGVAIGQKIPGAILYVEGIPFETGVLRITKMNQSSISVAFASYAIDFAARAEAVKLRDLDLQIDVAEPFTPEVVFEMTRISPIQITELWIRINGIDYRRDFFEVEDWVADINAAHPGLITLTSQSTLVHLFTLNAVPDMNQLVIDFVPGPFSINDIVYAYGVFLDSNYLTETQRIVGAYLALDTEADDSLFRLPTIYAPEFYDDRNALWGGLANRYDAAQGGYLFEPFYASSDETGWEDAFLPQPRVALLLETALSRLGYSVRGSLSLDADLRELLLWNNHDLNVRLYDLGPETPGLFVSAEAGSENAYIVPRPTFNLADHAPDLTALQLVLMFAETFAHIVAVENDQVTFTPIKDLLRAAAQDYTSKVERDYTATFSEATRPVLDYSRQGDESIFPGQLERTTLPGNGEPVEYVLPVFSVFEQERSHWIDGRIRVPNVADEGRNETLDLGTEARLRFFFHRGIQPDSTTNRPYPQAGHSLQGYATAPIGKYAMSWEGEGGLFEAWWKELIGLNQYGRQLSVVCRLTVADLLDIRQWRNVRKYLRLDDGTYVGVIRSVKTKVSSRGVGLSTVVFQLEPS